MNRLSIFVLGLLAVALVGCSSEAPTLTPEEKEKFSKGGVQDSDGSGGGVQKSSSPSEATADEK